MNGQILLAGILAAGVYFTGYGIYKGGQKVVKATVHVVHNIGHRAIHHPMGKPNPNEKK